MIGKEKERGDLFMNKNLKRALNTTAAVSMSLAMVLGAVAPVTNVSAAEIEDVVDKKDDIVDLLDMLGDVTTIALDEKVGKLPNATAGDTKEYTFEELIAKYESDLENAYKYASVAGYTEEQTETLKHLVGTEIVKGETNVMENVDNLFDTTRVAKLMAYNSNKVEEYLDIYEETADLLAFKENMPTKRTIKIDLGDGEKEHSYDEVLDVIEDSFADLEADVKDYKEDNVTSYAKAFAKKLADEKVAGVTVGALVDDEAAIPYTSLTTVENFIKKITKDSYSLTVVIDEEEVKVKYGDVKEEDVVADYIEGLEAIAAGMKNAKELIADTKDEKKAFDKLDDKLKSLAALVKTGEDDNDQLDKIDDAIAEFRAKDIEALKAYVDTVVNEFWTVAVDQRTSGSYRVKEVDAGLGRYYSFEDVAGKDLYKLMTTLVDRDEEETYYDVLVADSASVDELLKAVTTDIEGMTMNTVMTNQQVAKIIAARKALTKIDAGRNDDKDKDTSIYTNDLTRAERAEVDANREMIEVLYVKLLLNGEVTTVGWVETAKGWEYYDNNGKRVYEGWAPGNGYWSFMKNGYSVSNEWCAAKEGWYYMGADGKMVTGKVMINGVEEDFGTDGIWVRK